MPYNIRRPAAEPYDPTQRIVGGVVLFLIMLLIYSTLKLLLGLSAAPTGKFGLSTPLGDEITNLARGEDAPAEVSATRSVRPTRRIPQGFVFLDIDGNPMGHEVYQQAAPQAQQQTNDVAAPIDAEAYVTAQDGKNWYVQAASFREEERAQALVNQIRGKNIATTANIAQKGTWYVVRLPPQIGKSDAEQQRKQLYNLLRVRGKVKKIE